jgi:hypothetical protein
MAMALQGNLKDFSLADVFRLLANGQKTGTLHITRTGAEGQVCFDEGRVFFATSNWNRESLGKRLVKAGIITEKQLKQALGLQKIQRKDKTQRRLGQILIDEGYIDARVLETFIQEQINDTLFDLFRWDEGEISFATDEVPESEDIGISVSVENIIMESARRLELWNRIRQKIPSMGTVFKMADAPAEKSLEIHLKPREWMLLCFMHGERTVGELVEATGYNDFEVCKILYGMFAAGLIELAGEVVAEPAAPVPDALSSEDRMSLGREPAASEQVIRTQSDILRSADEL